MIRHLSGTVISLDNEAVVIDVQGIGYKVSCPSETLLSIRVGSPIALHTHLAVRETALDLYGFSSSDTLTLFEMLLSVSGIGPKTALGILSLAGAEALRTAIREHNPTYLVKVAGVGKKTAEKVVHELKDKAMLLGEGGEAPIRDTETIEALQAMGYTLNEAREAVKTVSPDIDDSSLRLKAALQSLSK